MNCMNFVTILSLCIPNYIKYFISELLNFLLDFTILHMKIWTILVSDLEPTEGEFVLVVSVTYSQFR